MARSSLACSRTSISLISSSSSVPPFASSNLPMRRATAPVNAPFSWPNSSDSSRFSGIAAQLTEMNGPLARRERAWMWRASTSLPVPHSPVISTEASDAATCSASLTTVRHACRDRSSRVVSSATAARMAAIRSGSGGSGMNSFAPARMAATAARASLADAAGDDRHVDALGVEPGTRRGCRARHRPSRGRRRARSAARASACSMLRRG